MGSEGPKSITIHVTGFKKFLGVSDNPTEKIANNLKSYVEKRGLPSGLSLGSCTILDTAGEGAKSKLYEVLESSVVSGDKNSNATVVWVRLYTHFFNDHFHLFLEVISFYSSVSV